MLNRWDWLERCKLVCTSKLGFWFQSPLHLDPIPFGIAQCFSSTLPFYAGWHPTSAPWFAICYCSWWEVTSRIWFSTSSQSGQIGRNMPWITRRESPELTDSSGICSRQLSPDWVGSGISRGLTNWTPAHTDCHGSWIRLTQTTYLSDFWTFQPTKAPVFKPPFWKFQARLDCFQQLPQAFSWGRSSVRWRQKPRVGWLLWFLHQIAKQDLVSRYCRWFWVVCCLFRHSPSWHCQGTRSNFQDLSVFP